MDQKKFEELYKEHASEIFRYNMFKLNNRENAEDVTSEAFVRLAESNLKHEDNLRAWLFQVSRNIMFDPIDKGCMTVYQNYSYFTILQNKIYAGFEKSKTDRTCTKDSNLNEITETSASNQLKSQLVVKSLKLI